MAASAALVLPSLEEGFGLPVVEAMAAGLPVVCSRGSALEEVAGEAATLVNPLDTRSIADGMEKILDDPARAEKQRAMGLDRSRQFDWDIAAARTLEFYRRGAGLLIRSRDRRARALGTAHRHRTVPAQPAARLVRRRRRDRLFVYFDGPAPADPVLGSPVDRCAARWAPAGRAGPRGRSASCRGRRAGGRRRRLLRPRLHAAPVPGRPARGRRPRRVLLLRVPRLRRDRRAPPAGPRRGEHARRALRARLSRPSPGARSRGCSPTLRGRVVHVPLGADDDLPPAVPATPRAPRSACGGR